MVGEPSTVAIFIITGAFLVAVVGGGWLILRLVRNPDAAIGARTRRRWEEHEDQRRLELERRRLEEERRIGDLDRLDEERGLDGESGRDGGKDWTDE
ncbi:hypothetical protein BSP109_00119 [Brevibacterium sp. Mu109]|uniref:hypothetical protein n=1 Tax=Brevibacterium sp. Mu109 TaxID=1255669 RepID=UPI000C670113|nr:hypothetical protein [Brevibacterium sp. Mu109]SMX64788.1 hypothetical protein BSP109_00119 [Brevibacterium sp. Mu109]